MDLVKQSTGQVRAVIASMPMQSRVLSAILVTMVMVGLTLLVRSADVSKSEELFGGRVLMEHELDAIELAFSKAGLNDWRREGRRISIPSQKRSEYLATLSDTSSLPITLRNHTKDAIEAANLFDSSSLRNAREMLAKEQDLGIKISAFPDIQWASVEYDQGERRGLSATRPQSASVLVIPEGNQSLNGNRRKNIEELVRGSYAGLNAEDIVVIDTNSNGSSSVENDDPLLRKQREAEMRIEQKIRALLTGFPAKVAVSAQIDPTMDVEKAVLKFQPNSESVLTSRNVIEVARRPSALVDHIEKNASAIGNRATILNHLSSEGHDGTETKVITGQEYEASRLASLQVQSVRVSVGLPISYYEQLHFQESSKNIHLNHEEKPPLMTEADLDLLRGKTKRIIQTAVTVLLPQVELGSNDAPLVEVWDYTDFPSNPTRQSATANGMLTWISESWQSLVFVVFAFLALWVARSTTRDLLDRKFGSSDSAVATHGEAADVASVPFSDSEGLTNQSQSLREDLQLQIDANPEIATSVIRKWFSEAA
ncbi:beta-cystathionase [bacterium]|nr:beta-cystathionase [bacterium]